MSEVRFPKMKGSPKIENMKSSSVMPPILGGETYYRLTEDGAYRITEDATAVRIIEETP